MNAAPRFHHFAIQDVYATACSDAAFCVQLLELFLSVTPGTMRTLDSALLDGDRAVWRHASHTLKGNALLIGARKLGELAANMERAGRQGSADDPAQAASALRHEYAQVMREIAECAAFGADVFTQVGARC
jgi:HPt (histidine-containing phosphotransfer) domain-containing protein